ncbi:hypothetical protein [Glycomyces sp. MUSA5-2]|uniref:hypothetical protein n=1 Tax=Glycomyces sp. MUSA5-2 TaxID=2053002 RepID=UPI00300B0046
MTPRADPDLAQQDVVSWNDEIIALTPLYVQEEGRWYLQAHKQRLRATVVDPRSVRALPDHLQSGRCG